MILFRYVYKAKSKLKLPAENRKLTIEIDMYSFVLKQIQTVFADNALIFETILFTLLLSSDVMDANIFLNCLSGTVSSSF